MKKKIKHPTGGRDLVVWMRKPPRRRFKPGDKFKIDGGIYQIVYMYRLNKNPHTWYHCLEEMTKNKCDLLLALGAGETTPRIVYEEVFLNYSDASYYFGDIPVNGSRLNWDTQKLLKAEAIQ